MVNTRMHSSRMCAVCCSGRLMGMGLPGGGLPGQIHACENITFLQLLLRTVIMHSSIDNDESVTDTPDKEIKFHVVMILG